MDDLNALLIEPHYSNRFIAPLNSYFSKEKDKVFVEEVCDQAGLPENYVSNSEGWVSEQFMYNYCLVLAQKLYGLQELPRDNHPFWQCFRLAHRDFLRREVMGPIVRLMSSFGSPSLLFKSVPKMDHWFSPYTHAKLVSHKRGQTELALTYSGIFRPIGRALCSSALGLLEAGPTLWGLPPAEVSHPQCQFKSENPAVHCYFIINYQQHSLWMLVVPLLLAISGGILGWGIGTVTDNSLLFNILLGAFAGLGVEGWRRSRISQKYHKEDTESMKRLVERSDERYEKLWKEGAELRHSLLTNKKISPYLPPELMRSLQKDTSLPKLGGEIRNVTVLFSDLQGYSTISEHLEPGAVLALLNEYFGYMSEIIETWGGVTLEYTGDGLLAVFGAPNHIADHPDCAINCALQMIAKIKEINKIGQLGKEVFLWDGGNQLSQRIGVHSGSVIAGNIGSPNQMKYGVVGDTVNVSARLEGLNKELQTKILISGETVKDCSEELRKKLHCMGSYNVKGRIKEVEVYTVK